MYLWIVFFFLVVSNASGQSLFKECLNCFSLANILEVDECERSIAGKCNIFECGLFTDNVDYEACGCNAICLDPVLQCLQDCTPPCLETVAAPLINCMLKNQLPGTPECKVPCPGSNLSDFVPTPMVTNPRKQCTLSEVIGGVLLNDCISRIFPVFPSCDAVQVGTVDSTCDALECCSVCQTELLDLENCFYNWISGRECSFSCTTETRNRLLLDASTHRNMQNEALPEFAEECRKRVASDLFQNTTMAVNNYLECIISNSKQLADSIRPDTTPPTPAPSPFPTSPTSPTPSPNLTSGAARLLAAFPFLSAMLWMILV